MHKFHRFANSLITFEPRHPNRFGFLQKWIFDCLRSPSKQIRTTSSDSCDRPKELRNFFAKILSEKRLSLNGSSTNEILNSTHIGRQQSCSPRHCDFIIDSRFDDILVSAEKSRLFFVSWVIALISTEWENLSSATNTLNA